MRPDLDLLELQAQGAQTESLCRVAAQRMDALDCTSIAVERYEPTEYDDGLTVFRDAVEASMGFYRRRPPVPYLERRARALTPDERRAMDEHAERHRRSAFWIVTPADGLKYGLCIVSHPLDDDADEWGETAYEIDFDYDRDEGVVGLLLRSCRVDAAALAAREVPA